jgi:hypothetical protein
MSGWPITAAMIRELPPIPGRVRRILTYPKILFNRENVRSAPTNDSRDPSRERRRLPRRLSERIDPTPTLLTRDSTVLVHRWPLQVLRLEIAILVIIPAELKPGHTIISLDRQWIKVTERAIRRQGRGR